MFLEYHLPASLVGRWCLEVNRRPSGDNAANRLGGEEGLSPRFVSGEVGHLILGCVRIEVAAALYELWALASPAPVFRGIAVDAVEGFVCHACARPMIACAGAAGVLVFSAVLGHVTPALTFEAAHGLLFVLDWMEVFHVVVEAVKY